MDNAANNNTMMEEIAEELRCHNIHFDKDGNCIQ